MTGVFAFLIGWLILSAALALTFARIIRRTKNRNQKFSGRYGAREF